MTLPLKEMTDFASERLRIGGIFTNVVNRV